MKLSTCGKYGLYAMYYLAIHAGEGPQTLQNISTVGVPKQYLEQILGNLRRAGLDAVEGPIELSECAASEHTCHKSGTCPVRWVWQRVTDSINSELEKIKLSDMLRSSCESEEINHE